MKDNKNIAVVFPVRVRKNPEWAKTFTNRFLSAAGRLKRLPMHWAGMFQPCVLAKMKN